MVFKKRVEAWTRMEMMAVVGSDEILHVFQVPVFSLTQKSAYYIR